MNVPKLHEVSDLTVQTSAVSVLDQVSPATMPESQSKDSVLGHPICVKGKKPKGVPISTIRCKALCTYLLQIGQLVMKQVVLHWIYITNNIESHQLVLSKEYYQAVLHLLHDDYGHQALDCTLALVRERFY